MKLIILIVFICALTLKFDNIQSANLHHSKSNKAGLKSQLKTKAEKFKELSKFDTKSIMEYLNTVKKAKGKRRSLGPQKNKHGEISVTKNKTVEFVKGPNPNVILEKADELSLLKEGWAKVSSPQFKNINLFPHLNRPDNTKHPIPQVRNYFRVNQFFDPVRNKDSGPGPYFFWFRLSKKNLYYSISKSSLNVVGGIKLVNIENAEPLKDFDDSDKCFVVMDNIGSDWTVCAETKKDRNQFVCKIKAAKKLDDEDSCLTKVLNDETVVEKKILQPIIMLPKASNMCNQGFSYKSNGSDWECDCKEGKFLI